MKNLGNGNFGILGGDIDQNGYININDVLNFENNLILFNTGYLIGDLTGDGLIESSDYSLLENNLTNIIFKP